MPFQEKWRWYLSSEMPLMFMPTIRLIERASLATRSKQQNRIRIQNALRKERLVFKIIT